RAIAGRRLHRFSWINEWKECADAGRSVGIEIVLPDWFYGAITQESLVLKIHSEYFALRGGIERWLYRLVRKHGGHQRDGWQFPFRHLYRKSGSLARYSDFSLDVRRIAMSQPLPGYALAVQRDITAGDELLVFRPVSSFSSAGAAVENRWMTCE